MKTLIFLFGNYFFVYVWSSFGVIVRGTKA